MSFFSWAWDWVTTSANWHGSDSIPQQVVAHLGYSALPLLIAVAIGIPAGVAIGHTGHGTVVAAAVVNASRAIPTLGLLILLAVNLGFSPLTWLLPLVVLAVPPILVNAYEGVAGVAPGVKDAAIATPESYTGAAYIFVEETTGNNAIIVSPGAASLISVADIEAHAGLIRSAGVFVTQLEQPVEAAVRALEIARAAGVATILNPAPAAPLPDGIFALCDYVTPNETEAAGITGMDVRELDSARRAADLLLAKGVGTAIVTLGENGALVHGAGHSDHVPAFEAGPVVETTGAGDAWQMPQGGIDAGEVPEAAAVRELYEETGVAPSSLRPLGQTPDWLTYDLPPELLKRSWQGRYRGQAQKWFAFGFLGTDEDIDVLNPGDGHKPEFDAWRWAPFPELVPDELYEGRQARLAAHVDHLGKQRHQQRGVRRAEVAVTDEHAQVWRALRVADPEFTGRGAHGHGLWRS